MKLEVQAVIRTAISAMIANEMLSLDSTPEIHLERTRQKAHGDYASNVALSLAKRVGMNPRELAARIVEHLPESNLLDRAEIAGPGFINLYLTKTAGHDLVRNIRQSGDTYGTLPRQDTPSIMVEYVSANPTGPLHVGHGRGAAYGDALVRVLRKAGYQVASEYYVNDAGRQMDILAVSVWIRYLELCGIEFSFPSNAYQGDYIYDIAATVHRSHADTFSIDVNELLVDLPDNDESKIDEIIHRAKHHLGVESYRIIFDITRDTLVDDIRTDLSQFGVDYDCWFSERSLMTSGAIDRSIQQLHEKGHLYEKEGAKWFKSTDFGDEKDRVVQRANGNYTYFASDIAYALNKKERGFEQLIYIWGADHHGYITRTKAAFEALGNNPDEFTVLLVQFAILYRGGEKASMSTRGGDFVTLRELRDEVGNDAARFFYAMRKSEQHMDFDLDLAKSRSNDNPVYYIQYAHARVCSVFRQLKEKSIEVDTESADLSLLTETREDDLIRDLSRFPEVIDTAARNFEPHQVAYYLRDLANAFHAYYNAHPFIAVEADLRNARLTLIDATRQVIKNGLDMLGVSAPESM